jgi:hypothetical protein
MNHNGPVFALRSSETNAWLYSAMTAMQFSDDAIEGPIAFAEKRAPVWTGC